ncbi:HTH_48 domain-containing protein [Nephila pilipes]|uniref:HTH_48 domain-containing protein n=1 Tax=Nephila pilipes TaxID=299642 RepID=A0A8X6I6T1_NEPPI|nr:HTH_48 domain-containing protein [Nephila pilipes]
MGVTQIKEWFNRFKDGRTSAESEQRCGRPQTARSAANVERVRNLVMADHRLTVWEIAEEVVVSKDSAYAILRENLNMNRVAAKFIPKLLSPEQKDLRFDVAQDLLDTANTDPGFLNTVITGDESWVHHGCKQIIKGKPFRFEYRVWCLNTKLVYPIQFEPYKGKETVLDEHGICIGGAGAGVLDLIYE